MNQHFFISEYQIHGLKSPKKIGPEKIDKLQIDQKLCQKSTLET